MAAVAAGMAVALANGNTRTGNPAGPLANGMAKKPADRYATHTTIFAGERLHRLTSNNIGAAHLGLLEYHRVKITAANLLGCPRGQLPVQRARGDGNEPSVHSRKSINFHAMFTG